MKKRLYILLFLYALSLFAAQPRTQVVILGSGNPNPDPGHSGCSVAVVVDTVPYIVDFGPGVIRQAAALSPRYGGGIEALNTRRITRAFLTHLHSDHTVGFPDLIFTPWVMGRKEPLQVYGPEGTAHMAEHILEAYREDIRYRLYGAEPANNQGWRVKVHEFHAQAADAIQVVYRDSRVTVEAFPVTHGSWPNAFGFRFTTPDRIIVISGDTRPCERISEIARGADVLIHEVYSQAGWETKTEFWKAYHKKNHTSTLELGEIAQKARPGLLILYHTLYWGSTDDDLLREIGSVYDGKVLVGQDGAVY